MPEKTKQKEIGESRATKESEENSVEELKPDERGNWSEDQQKKSYYYDDDYGYEVYHPDADDEDAENH